jgi:hypothetical protein
MSAADRLATAAAADAAAYAALLARRDRRWALHYACTDQGDWCVTQGAWDYCERNGHATYTVNGEVREHCPRCGRNRDAS